MTINTVTRLGAALKVISGSINHHAYYKEEYRLKKSRCAVTRLGRIKFTVILCLFYSNRFEACYGKMIYL